MFGPNTIKIITLFLTLNILSHIVYFHYELESTTLCVEGNRIEIEKKSEFENCHAVPLSAGDVSVSRFNGQNCSDFSLDNHVNEDITKSRVVKISPAVRFIGIRPAQNSDISFYDNTIPTSTTNHTLPEYKTVSLLI